MPVSSPSHPGRLFAAAAEPKELRWYDGGHWLPQLKAPEDPFAFDEGHVHRPPLFDLGFWVSCECLLRCHG